MIKFVIGNESLYEKLQGIPVLKKFFVFDISKLETIYNRQLFDSIFSSISNPNGTSKTTAISRLKELDKKVVELLPEKPLQVHDMAVSSGLIIRVIQF